MLIRTAVLGHLRGKIDGDRRQRRFGTDGIGGGHASTNTAQPLLSLARQEHIALMVGAPGPLALRYCLTRAQHFQRGG